MATCVAVLISGVDLQALELLAKQLDEAAGRSGDAGSW